MLRILVILHMENIVDKLTLRREKGVLILTNVHG